MTDQGFRFPQTWRTDVGADRKLPWGLIGSGDFIYNHDVNDPVTRGFIHGTGHGVGLEIHEVPSVGRAGTSPLALGDVVTVEPGIYEPGVGGVRLEDMLVITVDGSRNLTRAPRQLVV